jgi:hypothetical protein
MKKLALLSLALILSFGAFAQAKYQAKVVVLFMGEKNPTFEESKFPNIDFYYTPGITMVETDVITGPGALLGLGGHAMEFSGTPAEAYFTEISGGVFFDKNGYVSGSFRGMGDIVLSPKKNLQGSYDYCSYNDISKDYIKKGDETKKAKKAPRKPKILFDYYGMEIPADFEVENAAGKKASVRSLVKGEPLTILYTLYMAPEIDLKAGLKSGEGKSGKDFLKSSLSTTVGIGALAIVEELEEGIFGTKVDLTTYE